MRPGSHSECNLPGRRECIAGRSGGSNLGRYAEYASTGDTRDRAGSRPYTADLVSQRPALGCLFEIVETLVLTAIIFLVIQNFVAQPYQVQQMSMERSLEPGQYVLVDKLTPRFDTYKRGDVVVFNPPTDWVQSDGTPFIKRVIGVAGDTVEIQDGRVVVNGTRLDEPYVFTVDGRPQDTNSGFDRDRWVIPDGELFLMGDHRSASQDSRHFGPIKVDTVVGRAWLRYWPFDQFTILPTPSHPELTPSPDGSPAGSPEPRASEPLETSPSPASG
jgi:signal peptidase I